MDNMIEKNNNISLAKYISKIKKKMLYHDDLPEELKNNISIIHAEVAAKTRVFGLRGYDVIRNRFFVSQVVKIKYGDRIVERSQEALFQNFEEYFEYLDGNIYESACYYQYEFSRRIVDLYKIDLKKISTKSFENDTLSKCSKKRKNEEKDYFKKQQKKRSSLLRWREKFCACENYGDLEKVAKAFEKSDNCDWDYALSSFALFNIKRNIPLVIRFIMENKYVGSKNLLPMLCIQYGDDSIFDCFDSRYWQRKSEIKSFIDGLADGSIIEKCYKFYDEEIGFFCISKLIIDTKAVRTSNSKGRIVYYYENFDEFLKACDYDISDTDLADASIDHIDLSRIKINENTQLPLSSIENPYYCIQKYYDPTKDIFLVKEEWRAMPQSPILKEREYEFEYFVDFVAFLEGDLSGADLLLCDGLSFVNDFTQINLNGALVISDIKKKAGLLIESEMLSFSSLESYETTSSIEMDSPNVIISRPELSLAEQRELKRICYISDLHLPHRIHTPETKTKEDILAIIKRIVLKLTSALNTSDILLIVGDTSCDLTYFKLFVKMLGEAIYNRVVFVLGNHELWGFEQTSFEDIVSVYRDILDEEGMLLLQNNIVFSTDDKSPLQTITEKELANITEADLRAKMINAQTILFGGLAFSGLNNTFNAKNGVYKKAITREIEIEESRRFEALYTKIRNCLANREVIVATHTPLSDWSNDTEYHSGYVYVSGHTHRIEYYDDGIKRIYADNQIGYRRKDVGIKSFYIEGKYDLFENYTDGIYEITRSEYSDFYRGKNIKMDFNRSFTKLYMLKRKGYYTFIIQTEHGKFSILNGGNPKNIKTVSIESCYDEMGSIIDSIKTPLDKFTNFQKQIADFVKSIGGEGRIHGAIIDIDFFNHIYVNPNDLKITFYSASSIVDKIVFGSFQSLLSLRRPDLMPEYNKCLSGNTSAALIIKQNEDNNFVFEPYLSTDIYAYSNDIKKMQRLYSNILTIWPTKNKLNTIPTTNSKLLKNSDDMNP